MRRFAPSELSMSDTELGRSFPQVALKQLGPYSKRHEALESSPIMFIVPGSKNAASQV